MTQDRRPDSLIGKDSPNQRSGSLLELAKKRLASVDARSDGNEDGDETLRQEALKYISKECLSLPDAEFLKLLSKIEEVLRKKGADIGNVRSESQEALKEISWDLSLLPLSNFDPKVENPEAVADYVEKAMFTKDSSEAFLDAIRSNPKCAAWFAKNWNGNHPVGWILKKRGFASAKTLETLDIAASLLVFSWEDKWWVEKAVRNRNEAIAMFKSMVRDGFPDPKNPKTAETLSQIFTKGGDTMYFDFIKILKSDPKTALEFIEVWELGAGNPVRKAFEKHPDPHVRWSPDNLDGIKRSLAVSYGFDADALPNDFRKIATGKIDRFKNRNERAKTVAEWNSEMRRTLTEKWNVIVKARMEGDIATSVKTGFEVEGYFEKEFKSRQDQANKWFYGLVGEQQPDEYRQLLAIGNTKQLFKRLRNTFGDDENDTSRKYALTPETEKDVRNYDTAFKQNISAGYGNMLVRNDSGELETQDSSVFANSMRNELASQKIKDHEGLMNYVSYAFVRWGKQKFAEVVRSDFGNGYDAFVLKMADNAGKIAGWSSKRSSDWGKTEQILSETDLDASQAFDEFLSAESEAIIKNRKAIEDQDFSVVRNALKSKLAPDEIEKTLLSMKGKSTREQFEIILDRCPDITHREVEEIFLEVSKNSKDAATAYENEAKRIIPDDEIMEYVPGFVHLKFALARTPENETPEEAAKRKALLWKLHGSDRLKAVDFFKENREHAEYFVKLLNEYGQGDAIRNNCETFASWLRNKALSWKNFKNSVTAKSVADTAKKKASETGMDWRVADSKAEYEQGIRNGEVLAESLYRKKLAADSLEADGKIEEAAELRRLAYWSAGGEKESEAVSRIARSSPERVASLIVTELPVGRTVRVPVGNESTNVTVEKTSDSSKPYVVKVDGKESFVCTDKNLAANLQMAELLSQNGLAFLAPLSGELLKRSSVAKGDLATANDGDFWDREKRELLSAAAKALGIADFPHASTEVSEMSRRFQSITMQENASVRELGIRNGVLDVSGNVKNREEFLASVRE